MFLLESYLLRRVVAVFVATLLATVAVTWVVQLLSRINFLTTSGQNFLTLLKFSLFFIPPIIPFVMPFALVLAVTLVLLRMNQDSELVVITASGAPRRTIWRPIVVLAVFVSVTCFIITNFVAPHARLAMRGMVAQSHSDIINLLLQEGNFRQISEGIYIEIGERRSDGSIGKLFIVDESSPDVEMHYYALDGIVAKNDNDREAGYFLILKRGEIQRIDKKRDDVSIIQFDSYSFDLSSFAPVARNITTFPKDLFLTALLDPDPDDSYYQRRPLHYTAELHQRLSVWLFPIVFVMIALVAAGGARSHRQTRASGALITLSLTLLLYWLKEIVADWSENDPAFWPLFYLIPLGALVILIIMLLRGYRLALPDGWHDRFSTAFERIKIHPRQGSGSFIRRNLL